MCVEIILTATAVVEESLTRTVKVRPPTRFLASSTTGFSPLAFNSLAALKPVEDQDMSGKHTEYGYWFVEDYSGNS